MLTSNPCNRDDIYVLTLRSWRYFKWLATWKQGHEEKMQLELSGRDRTRPGCIPDVSEMDGLSRYQLSSASDMTGRGDDDRTLKQAESGH